jgi:uncharacterized membrane protein
VGLDIRIPIGAMFGILGLLLTVYGFITVGDVQAYDKSLSINVNLWWGAAMFVFGLVMLYYGWRGSDSSAHLTEISPKGRAIEKRKHRAGLESD